MGRRLDNATALYLEAIRDGNADAAIERYAGDRYTQHSAPVKDGKEGFKQFFADFTRRNPIREIEIVRGFEDGRYVFLHVVQILNHGEHRYVTADVFDTDDEGKLVEHWDIIAELVDDTASGSGQVDGPTVVTDLDLTEANKETVRRFVTDVLIDGRTDVLADYVSTETYVEHDPRSPARIEGLRAFGSRIADQRTMAGYERVHLVVGSGNFVATLSEAKSGDTGLAILDLFRLDRGMIVEHWDVVEEILPEEQWVNSGKF